MLAQVDPSRATRSEKWKKKGRAQNTVKRGGFWPDGVGRRQGAGEERNAFGKDAARGPLAG